MGKYVGFICGNQISLAYTSPCLDAALAEHGPGIRRAYIQSSESTDTGSAADMTKKAMIELHKEGISSHIQVHDELDISVDNNADKIKDIMESAAELEVPNKVDYESGNKLGYNKMRKIMAYLNANIPVEYAQIRREYLYDLKTSWRS